MSTAANDFLAVEPHIVARLQQALAGMSPAVQVLTGAELAGIKEAAQRTPAVHVIWGGFRLLETRTDGSRRQVRLRSRRVAKASAAKRTAR